jgi:FixJ family two-component response regulator
MRLALEDLVSTVGLEVREFTAPQEFLRRKPPDTPGCLVLDVPLPGMNGLTFHKECRRSELTRTVASVGNFAVCSNR